MFSSVWTEFHSLRSHHFRVLTGNWTKVAIGTQRTILLVCLPASPLLLRFVVSVGSFHTCRSLLPPHSISTRSLGFRVFSIRWSVYPRSLSLQCERTVSKLPERTPRHRYHLTALTVAPSRLRPFGLSDESTVRLRHVRTSLNEYSGALKRGARVPSIVLGRKHQTVCLGSRPRLLRLEARLSM